MNLVANSNQLNGNEPMRSLRLNKGLMCEDGVVWKP